jgi:heat shock protein HslJ
MRKALATVATLALAAACGQDSPERAGAAPPPADAPAESESAADADADTAVIAGDWVLSHVGGEPVGDGVEPPTLTVMADGSVAGFAGVNRYTGRLGAAEGRLFGPMPTTMMAGPPEAMALEARFTAAMTAATDYEVEGDTLTLAGEGEELVFRRAGD